MPHHDRARSVPAGRQATVPLQGRPRGGRLPGRSGSTRCRELHPADRWSGRASRPPAERRLPRQPRRSRTRPPRRRSRHRRRGPDALLARIGGEHPAPGIGIEVDPGEPADGHAANRRRAGKKVDAERCQGNGHDDGSPSIGPGYAGHRRKGAARPAVNRFGERVRAAKVRYTAALHRRRVRPAGSEDEHSRRSQAQ